MAFLLAAGLFLLKSPWWWVAAAPAVVLSQIAIFASWHDARFGTIPNLIVLVPLALAILDLRPSSVRSQYRHEVPRVLATNAAAPVITEADLAPLPALLQIYLRRTGVVGHPRPHNFRAHFKARMRAAPDAAWMDATVDQVEAFGEQPARLFFMEASRAGIPFDVFHRYVGDAASMRVRIAGLVPVVDVTGPEITRSETVTLFNDMCFWAPGALLAARVSWEPIDARTLKGTFTNAGHTISAELTFDQHGDLVGFLSHDRFQSDGKQHRLLPWSTPARDYRTFGHVRIAARGDARWQEPMGEWTYGEFELESITYNVVR